MRPERTRQPLPAVWAGLGLVGPLAPGARAAQTMRGLLVEEPLSELLAEDAPTALQSRLSRELMG